MKIDKLEDIKERWKISVEIESRKENKRYCVGQPQLRYGKYVFSNSILEGMEKFGLGNPEFPILYIDCK